MDSIYRDSDGTVYDDVANAEPGKAPDATTYVEAAMEAMKSAGGLE